jgi:hypothetical protein
MRACPVRSHGNVFVAKAAPTAEFSIFLSHEKITFGFDQCLESRNPEDFWD